MEEAFVLKKKLNFGWEHILAIQGCVNFILIVALLIAVGSVATPVASTLNDVQEMLPEMNRTVIDLGQLTPEIRRATRILDILCDESPVCM